VLHGGIPLVPTGFRRAPSLIGLYRFSVDRSRSFSRPHRLLDVPEPTSHLDTLEILVRLELSDADVHALGAAGCPRQPSGHDHLMGSGPSTTPDVDDGPEPFCCSEGWRRGQPAAPVLHSPLRGAHAGDVAVLGRHPRSSHPDLVTVTGQTGTDHPGGTL
jgi:hypothetical protein